MLLDDMTDSCISHEDLQRHATQELSDSQVKCIVVLHELCSQLPGVSKFYFPGDNDNHTKMLRCMDQDKRISSMELMDLPDDCLAGIIFTALKNGDWYALDMAMCNKRLLKIIQDNAGKIIKLLYKKPWGICKGVLHTFDVDILEDEIWGLDCARYYLERKWIKRVDLTIASDIMFPVPEELEEEMLKISSYHTGLLLDRLPRNKVVLNFSNKAYLLSKYSKPDLMG